ncbi:carbohydrate-binding protein [Sphaerimonospora cavernae]|uniref:Carbohydrate-binding protein n=1 Tax=Sphaerimonospora cavernae TaxID=1740611 RepID=A0ABV6TYL7_9ACTN
MFRRNSLIVAGALVAAGLTIPIGAAVAEPGPTAQEQAVAQAPAGDPPAGLVQAMQRDLGLNADQARTRLANEDRATRSEARLRGRLGNRFAGSWLSGADAKLVVATTDSAAKSDIAAEGAEAKVVKHPYAKLVSAKNALDRAASKAPKTAPVWYVDVQNNSVVVLSSEPAAAEKFVAASGLDSSIVRVEKSSEQPQTYYDLRGGDAYYIGSGSRCSIGFPVTKGTTQGFVTAGHCGNAGASTSGSNRVAQGTFQGSRFPGNDYAWVATNSNWTAQPYVNQNGGNLTVRGSTQALVGASICRSGSTTGWHCGTVQQHNTSVTYSQGTVSGVTRTSVCAEPGDSGGSFISNDQAQGVTSGGSGNCSSGGTTYYQPVNPILSAYGLTLKTPGSNPGPTAGPTSGPSNPPNPPAPGGTWKVNTSYAAGATVTYGGATYRCLQGHTSLPGWEPPNVPALWQRI